MPFFRFFGEGDKTSRLLNSEYIVSISPTGNNSIIAFADGSKICVTMPIDELYEKIKAREHKEENEKIARLEKEIADLKEKLHFLWYSPGMPGTILAKEEFEQLGRPSDKESDK
jgi:uncharacterized protein YlzI (FlbEa/FlbD family)